MKKWRDNGQSEPLGNVAAAKERFYESGRSGCLDKLRQDIRYALRTFKRSRGFTAVVVLTLALGIGATTAIFSIVEAVLLNPLPFPNQDRLVVIFEQVANRPNEAAFFDSYHDFENWKAGSHSFERLTVATWATGGQILTGAGPARDVLALPVGVDFFSMLGLAAEVGRTFEPDDVRAGCTIVLKHSFWTGAFGGQRDAIGQHIEINNDSCTVIGVMPPEFTFYPDATEMWMLITPDSPIAHNPEANVGVFGLLKSGVSIAQAEEELESLYKSSPRPNSKVRLKPTVYPLAQQFARLTGPTLRSTLVVVFGAVSLVLLIGCLNIANLLLGKSVARQKEMAVRAALGSGRARLLRQLLTEALLLSLIGSGLGVLLAMTAIHYFRTLNPIAMPPGNPVAINIWVLLFTGSLAVVTALLFGLVPSLKASRVDLMDGLRVSAQAASLGRAARTLRRGLVIVEVALSLALLVGAGLLVQSVQRLASVRFGFRTDVSTVDVNLPRWIYSLSEERARFFRAALDRIAVDSRFGAIALASAIPPDGVGGDSVVVDGKPESRAETAIGDTLEISVSPQYFKVMGVPLELGREFADTDSHTNTAVAIVNEAFARKYFSTENPIDRRVKMGRSGSDQPWLSIVGVVGNEKHQDFFHPMNWEETPIVFRPLHQEPPSRAFLVFRTSTDSNAVAATLRKSIQAVDASVAIGRVQTMNERLSDKLSYPRFRATILSTFAALALSLAAIGLYAVLSQLIAQRTQEFGVRMALGAQKTDLLKLVIWEGMLLTLAGLAVGLMITLFLTGLLRNLIYGLKTTDPWTLSLASLLLVFVALLAMYAPAVRATSVDPTIAVRSE